mmetsp:Transcript_69333/g.219384  ORF Transcript_69333/g.219384 Transcript_69333/m.219384 type:complete len:272 (-) Transcript_69333:77-892(-)
MAMANPLLALALSAVPELFAKYTALPASERGPSGKISSVHIAVRAMPSDCIEMGSPPFFAIFINPESRFLMSPTFVFHGMKLPAASKAVAESAMHYFVTGEDLPGVPGKPWGIRPVLYTAADPALVKALRETGLGRAPGSTIEVVDPHTTMVEGKPLVAVVDGAIGVIIKNIRQAALGQEITGKVTMEGHQDYEVRPRKAGGFKVDRKAEESRGGVVLSEVVFCSFPGCGAPGVHSDVKKCGGCRVARYHSKDCQRRHWKAGHKEECTPSA